jgi:hypothetical protein
MLAALANAQRSEPLQNLAMVRGENEEFLLLIAKNGSLQQAQSVIPLLVAKLAEVFNEHSHSAVSERQPLDRIRGSPSEVVPSQFGPEAAAMVCLAVSGRPRY